MKRFFIVLLTLVFAVSASDIAAQNLLKSLGKMVEQEVAKGVKRSVKNGIGNLKQKLSQKNDEEQSEQSAEQSSSSQSADSSFGSVVKGVLGVDEGQNIARETDCDYIDEYGNNHGGGIKIGDVVWAPVNCGYHKTDYPYGKLYQWGRKHGQGYGAPYADPEMKNNVRPDKTTAELVSAPVTPAEARKYPNRHYYHERGGWFNWTRNDVKLWNDSETMEICKNKVNDPCPEGWRVADLHDFQELIVNHSDETTYYDGGQKGRWFSGPNSYCTSVPRIFLSLGGMRDLDGKCYLRERSGLYWTGRHGGSEGLVWHLRIEKSGVEMHPMAWPHDAHLVRCVKDVPGRFMH
jgi:uncharacterized protein (TIGR02145 family)